MFINADGRRTVELARFYPSTNDIVGETINEYRESKDVIIYGSIQILAPLVLVDGDDVIMALLMRRVRWPWCYLLDGWCVGRQCVERWCVVYWCVVLLLLTISIPI